MAVEIPQLKFPLELDPVTDDFAVVEQDTADEIVQNVLLLLRTPLGWRQLEPGMGLPDPRFNLGSEKIVADVTHQITTYEPRAEDVSTDDVGLLENALAEVGIRVTIGN